MKLNKEELNIVMNLVSEKIVDMKHRPGEIDLHKFEQIILLGIKIEHEWFKQNEVKRNPLDSVHTADITTLCK